MPEKDPTTWTATTWVLAAVDVSEQAPAEALDRLGLRLSAEPEEM